MTHHEVEIIQSKFFDLLASTRAIKQHISEMLHKNEISYIDEPSEMTAKTTPNLMRMIGINDY